MLLYYIRHGDPIYSPDSLTPLGERQAEAAAKRLSVYGLDRIYVSSSMRAKLTAKPTAEILKITPTELDWCSENHAWRELTCDNDKGGRTWLFQHAPTEKIFNSPEVVSLGRKWYTHPAFTQYEAGIKRVEENTYALLSSLGYDFDETTGYYKCVSPNDERVALFAHQGFGMAFLSTVMNIPYPVFSTHFDISHSSITVIRFEGKGEETLPKMLQLSNDSHLYREGLPTRYNGRELI